MNNRKTFSDLDFNDHANVSGGVQAKLELDNDLEVSVVSMKGEHEGYGGLYGNVKEGTYEVAVFHHGNMLPLSPFDDVIGWRTEDELNTLLDGLQGDDRNDFIANLYIARDEGRAELGLDEGEEHPKVMERVDKSMEDVYFGKKLDELKVQASNQYKDGQKELDS